MEEKKEEYILVAVGREEDTAVSLRELADLLETAGGKAVDFVTQNLPHPDPRPISEAARQKSSDGSWRRKAPWGSK